MTTDGQILYEQYRAHLSVAQAKWGGNILSVTTSQGVCLPNTVQFGVPWDQLTDRAKDFWTHLAGAFQDALNF